MKNITDNTNAIERNENAIDDLGELKVIREIE